MSVAIAPVTAPPIIYPESDGQPMADNTKQFRWIVTIQGGLDALFQHDPQVFVAGDLLWYPVEGQPTICMAPDVLVVFGRPKGDRDSYLQWREGHIAPQVVFDVISPGNSPLEMTRKIAFYMHYGVEEYYLYDPDTGDLSGWRRVERQLSEIESMAGWVSPRLGVRFEMVDGELALYHPDGRRFATFVELEAQRAQALQQAELAQQLAQQAQQLAEQERLQREQAQARAEHLAARLRELGVDPDA